MPTSTIPRLYHSVASLTPSGEVMIAGSNPNDDISTTKYQTEYRVEWLRPPYIGHLNRPVIVGLPPIGNFDKAITLQIKTPGIKSLSRPNIKVIIMDFGFGKLFVSLRVYSQYLLSLMFIVLPLDELLYIYVS